MRRMLLVWGLAVLVIGAGAYPDYAVGATFGVGYECEFDIIESGAGNCDRTKGTDPEQWLCGMCAYECYAEAPWLPEYEDLCFLNTVDGGPQCEYAEGSECNPWPDWECENDIWLADPWEECEIQ